MKLSQLLLMSSLLTSTVFAQKMDELINKESQDKTSISKSAKNAKEIARYKAIIEKYAGPLSSKGGSGIGGGNIYNNLVDWCDNGFDILDESRIDAQDTLGIYGDKVSAIRTYYTGLIDALEATNSEEINTYSSIMYRSIVRGLNLAEYFGIIDILAGDTQEDHKKMDALYFLDDYYQFVLKTAYQFDRNYYLSYYTEVNCSGCQSIPRYSVADLERDFINYSVSQIDFWLKKFIRYSSNNENSYSTVDPRKAMAGLAYLSHETALDLEESLLNNVFSCQSRQLKRLAGRVERYLNQSPDGNLDAAKLTIFKEQAKRIAHNIKQKTCDF